MLGKIERSSSNLWEEGNPPISPKEISKKEQREQIIKNLSKERLSQSDSASSENKKEIILKNAQLKAERALNEEISLRQAKIKEDKVCQCIAKTTGIGCASLAIGTGAISGGLCIAGCVTGIQALTISAASIWTGTLIPISGAMLGLICAAHENEKISSDLIEEDLLEQASKNFLNSEFTDLIDAQNYENVEELIRLVDFHEYVNVCLKIKELRNAAIEEGRLYLEHYERIIKFKEKESKLALKIEQATNQEFKRIDLNLSSLEDQLNKVTDKEQ